MPKTSSNEAWVKVTGLVARGHGVASGQAKDSPYPDGTIRMQIPFFLERGLDLTKYHPATINISISPPSYVITNPEYTFRDVEWSSEHPPEHFSFSRCSLMYDNQAYDSWIYYPHPETKKRHFQNTSILEIISMYIPNLDYGKKVVLLINSKEIQLKTN